MKFLPLPKLDIVASALNIETSDCHVIGGCDLYTTKAAGSDKKLYRNIDKSLESQHESLVRMSSSFSPPDESLNLSRASPFGPLSQISSRRTFAYLISTLNASHPDYDFSHKLRPSDFRKETDLRTVMNTIDSTLNNFRPCPSRSLNMPSQSKYGSISPQTATDQNWGPHMWTCIDNEMGLKDCFIYAYEPADDPYEGEEGTIWSLNYFFFNKQLKRVAYLYIRGVPALSASHEIRKRSSSCYDIGANRRSRYLPGDRVDEVTGSDSDGVNRGLNDGEDDDDDDEDSDLMQGGSRSYDDYDDDVAARMELEL